MEHRIDDIFDEIIGTTLETYRILRAGGPDVERLFLFYLYTAKTQKTNRIYATTGYTATGLDIGEKRVQKAKNYLRDVGLITDECEPQGPGKNDKWYVRVSYVFRRSTLEGYASKGTEPTPSEIDPPRRIPPLGVGSETDGQYLNRFPSEINQSNSLMPVPSGKPEIKKNEAPYSCPVFREFWELYPKKVDKPKAWTLWAKLPDADRIQALEGLKAWKRLWNTFGPDDLRFVIYPERFIKLRRFEPETLSTELAPKLKERKVSSPEAPADALSKEEAAKKRADEKAADEERASARIKRETAEILRFFEAMPDQSRELMEAEAEKKCAGFAESRTKYPQAYQAAYRSALVGLVRPVWESSKE